VWSDSRTICNLQWISLSDIVARVDSDANHGVLCVIQSLKLVKSKAMKRDTRLCCMVIIISAVTNCLSQSRATAAREIRGWAPVRVCMPFNLDLLGFSSFLFSLAWNSSMYDGLT
jgi:hypothetical protein